MTVAQIDPLSEPPSRADPDNFTERSDTFLAEIGPFALQANALALQVNGFAVAAALEAEAAQTSSTAASENAQLSQDWAIKLGEPVAGGEYSAKYWAQAAEAAEAVLPDGTINDVLVSPTDTWSSTKLSTEFSGKVAATNGTASGLVLTDPKISLAGSNGTSGQALISQGLGLSPVWGSVADFVTGDIFFTNRDLSAPNWLPADGSLYLKTTYPDLSTELGSLPTPDSASSWTARSSGLYASLLFIAHGNGLYLTGGTNGVLSTSPNAVTWTSRTSGLGTSDISCAAYGNGLYLIGNISGGLATSPNGVTWTARTSGFAGTQINSIAYGNGVYVAVGSGGKITSSPDAITWTARTSGFGSAALYGVIFVNGKFIAFGENSTSSIATSTDGITWTLITSPGSVKLLNYSGNSFFAVVGNNKDIWTSKDLVTWSKTRVSSMTVVYGAGLFLLKNNGTSGISKSYDLLTSFGDIPYGLPSAINAGIYVNGMFVFVGDAGSISTSTVGYDISTQFATPIANISPASGTTAYVKV